MATQIVAVLWTSRKATVAMFAYAQSYYYCSRQRAVNPNLHSIFEVFCAADTTTNLTMLQQLLPDYILFFALLAGAIPGPAFTFSSGMGPAFAIGATTIAAP